MALSHARTELTVPPSRTRSRKLGRLARRVLVHAILLVGLVGIVVGVYLVIVVGLGRLPTDEQMTLLVLSMVGAAVAALLYVPARGRLERYANRLVRGEHGSPDDVLHTFSNRLTRTLPLDELLLQLAEALRRTLALEAAEVWTGSRGVLERAASDPDRGPGTLILASTEESVVARAGVSGSAWVNVWLPGLAGRDEAPLRVAPVTSSGELMGLIVVERPTRGEPFDEDEERVLSELARNVGLVLRNVRLDSALQASLEDLRQQAEELRASRARVVVAADAERRRIERDLHDGAQQHLMALAVNLHLARESAGTDPEQARALFEQLGRDVQEALDELRTLARGIYPPLLQDRGLAKALGAAARRAPVRLRLELSSLGRYSPEVEATVYFCCVEALQNTAKHGGPGVQAIVRIWEEEGGLLFEVQDDGVGFDVRNRSGGTGLTSLTDRLGAIGGSLRIESSPGNGTSVRGTIPLGS